MFSCFFRPLLFFLAPYSVNFPVLNNRRDTQSEVCVFKLLVNFRVQEHLGKYKQHIFLCSEFGRALLNLNLRQCVIMLLVKWLWYQNKLLAYLKIGFTYSLIMCAGKGLLPIFSFQASASFSKTCFPIFVDLGKDLK